MPKNNKVWQQRALPGVGEFIETLSLTLFWGTIINFVMIAGTFYFTTLRYVATWFDLPKFIAAVLVGIVTVFIITFKFVVPSLWAFRAKQMLQKDALIIIKLDKIIERIIPVKIPNKVISVSGSFDPIHIGHLRYIQDAMKLGSTIIVILTRDDQLAQKKGKPFMCYAERKEIVEAILGNRGVVVPNVDVDITSVESIRKYRPNIFAKGGDTWDINNLPEAKVCSELGIEVVFGVGGFDKVQSSRWLIRGKTNA